MAFKIAASMALKEAAKKCDPVILEPMMKVTIEMPEEYMGDIMGDVTSRRGRVDGMEPRGNAQVVNAFVPLSEMFGYATSLRSNTQGRGTYTMYFDHYAEVPKSISEDIIKKNSGNKTAEYLYWYCAVTICTIHVKLNYMAYSFINFFFRENAL